MRAAVALLVLIAVFSAAGFVAGWKVSETRFTRPVEVPLICDGGGGSPVVPVQPQ